MEIFVSSSCVRSRMISESLHALRRDGYTRVELSGGTESYPQILDDLIWCCEKEGMRLLPHNYFPPPSEHFVVNLASADDKLRTLSIEHLARAIRLASMLGADRFGFHAGFYFDFCASSIGEDLEAVELNDPSFSCELFLQSVSELKLLAEVSGVRLYIENNVLSNSNFMRFGQRPLMGLDSAEMLWIQEATGCNLLIDFAHLYVTCSSLGLDFDQQAKELAAVSDYWHLSANNGAEDLNQEIFPDDRVLKLLASFAERPEILTLEVYDGLSALGRSYQTVLGALE